MILKRKRAEEVVPHHLDHAGENPAENTSRVPRQRGVFLLFGKPALSPVVNRWHSMSRGTVVFY